MRRDRRERIGNDLSEYQKWVDYDMKKYGRISDITKGKIRRAGLSIVKDQYGDYEVIADRPIKEGLKEAKTKEIIVLQGNYGYGWDDLCSYESNQWREAKGDLNDYRENERDAIHRLIRRRVPTNGATVKEGCGKLNEKSDYNALRKVKEFIKNATTRVGFYDKIRAILKDAFIEDWDIKQLQRLADAKYEQLREVNESCKRRIREGSSYTVGDKMFKLNGINLKDWYTSEYPDDELGYELNDDVDLRRCYSSLGRDPDIYDVMGVGDSVIRERVFAKMADVMGVDYDVIYYKWLGR